MYHISNGIGFLSLLHDGLWSYAAEIVTLGDAGEIKCCSCVSTVNANLLLCDALFPAFRHLIFCRVLTPEHPVDGNYVYIDSDIWPVQGGVMGGPQIPNP